MSIKWVNGVSNDAATDIGRDNYQVLTEFNHSTVSKDVFSYELDYFNSDYRAIGTTDQQFKYPFNNFATETSAVSRQLFNANIIGMSTSLSQFGLSHYRYRYDQLNRLTEKHSFKQEIYGLEQTFDFAEDFIYDANGNILTANRNASMASPGGQVMDNLNYQFENNTNKLSYVTDQISATAKDYDIDGQPFQNYTYDLIGNLVSDAQEHITNINWSVYGKIRGIIKRNTTTGKETTTQYGYDPSGNRTYKEVIRRDIGNYSQDIVDRTYYVRDAQGNTMATYSRHEEPGSTLPLKWSEQHLYGSSRLGVMNLNLDIPAQPMIPQVNQILVDSLHTGQVVYDLTNHLGNVMATISDKKLFSNIVIPETGVAAFYYPEVLSQTESRIR